jgi:hypothetical protein
MEIGLMPRDLEGQNFTNLSERDLVLSTLEPDQLAEAKKRHVPRRRLRGPELLILWFLRIYLLFMIAVVVYQAWTGTH